MGEPDLTRIAVVGTACSGKTTLAGAIAARRSVPHIELDALFWLPDWQERETESFRSLVDRATAAPGWVACGNYSRARDLVWGRATALIWLNYSFPRVLGRGLFRTLRRGLSREELYAGNRESLLMSFFSRESILLALVTSYGKRERAYRRVFDGDAYGHLAKLEFRRPREADAFLSSL